MRLLLPLILLVGCQRHQQWQCSQIQHTTHQSTRLIYKTKDPVAGIDVALFRNNEKWTTYLQVHGHPLYSSLENEQKIEVRLISEGKVTSFLADLHRGRQRIRLSEILQDQLISELMEGNPVTIELSGYREIVSPKRFQKMLKKVDSKTSDFLSKFRASIIE